MAETPLRSGPPTGASRGPAVPPSTPPLGRVLTAMVTPFAPDGSLDLHGAARLATHLVDVGGNDGLVVSGTTGESPTTSDREKNDLLRVVVDAVGDRATVIAGVGTNDTAHTIELAQAAQQSGAHGLLVVSPYYSKPPQAALLQHFGAVADAVERPIMLYDIPGRTGVPIETETLVRLAEHPNIQAVKDAKGDLAASSWVMARSGIAYYSGDDMMNLPLLSVGAVGFVSVVAHFVGARLREMLDAYGGGHTAHALDVHRALLPVYTGLFRTQGVILTKAALNALGLPAGPLRPPLIEASSQQLAQLADDLAAGGVISGAAGFGEHTHERSATSAW